LRPLFLLLILLTALLNAATITVVAEKNCPYACADNAKQKGFVIDIVSHIFSQMDYKVEYITADSKEKAIAGLRTKKYDALIGVTSKEAPDLIFARFPLAYTYDTIVVPKHSKWKYKAPQSLNLLTLGVIKGRKYDALINRHIATYKDDNRKVQFAEGKYAGKENLKKLRYEKITALVDNQHKLQYFYHTRKKLFPFKVAKKLGYTPIKIAFSPKDYKAQRRARAFSHEFKKLRGSQQMRMILKQYGLIEQNILPTAEKR